MVQRIAFALIFLTSVIAVRAEDALPKKAESFEVAGLTFLHVADGKLAPLLLLDRREPKARAFLA